MLVINPERDGLMTGCICWVDPHGIVTNNEIGIIVQLIFGQMPEAHPREHTRDSISNLGNEWNLVRRRGARTGELRRLGVWRVKNGSRVMRGGLMVGFRDGIIKSGKVVIGIIIIVEPPVATIVNVFLILESASIRSVSVDILAITGGPHRRLSESVRIIWRHRERTDGRGCRRDSRRRRRRDLKKKKKV